MSDAPSDPRSSHALHSSPVDSIPPTEEPRTPAWLTLAGVGVLLVVLAWLAVRCGSESKTTAPNDGAAVPAASNAH